jgi:glycosyltransferase involved in cell wall biosynthesis
MLLIHNRYRSDYPSGENIAVERLSDLLRYAGRPHQAWTQESDDLLRAGWPAKARTAWHLPGHAPRRLAFAERLAAARANGTTIAHLHNPWPLFTYDVAQAAQDAGLPVVQTLHNYRLIGTNTRLVSQGMLIRPRHEADHLTLRRMANSHERLANLFYNRALASLWQQRIPQTSVDAFICLSHFQLGLMLRAGLPADRLHVVPNFLDHRGPVGDGAGNYALFVGRLDAMKGIDDLMRWWPKDGPPLRVIGSGPSQHLVARHPRITALGRLPFPDVQQAMARARFVVMNSRWYEPFGLVLIEALAAGTPCLVPDLGAMPEIIAHGTTGLVFPPDDHRSAAAAARELWERAPAMRAACRRSYEATYTPSRHLDQLDAVYRNCSVHSS